MRKLPTGDYLYSPSDLTSFMQSPFASWMERAAKEQPDLLAQKDKPDALMTSLQSKGYTHEARFYEQIQLANPSWRVIDISEEITENTPDNQQAITLTIEAMQQGYDVIFQGCLAHDGFRGFSDFLVKSPGASNLGDYHYQVWDTKLSKSVKPYFLIQLCAYAQMLEAIQGIKPVQVSVVLGNNHQAWFRTDDYYYAYLALKQRFVAMHQAFDLHQPADPADSKNWGDWSDYAKSLLHARDHLIQVANITRGQIVKLNAAGIDTMDDLAHTQLTTIPKLKPETFDKLKEQAQLQIETRQRQANGDLKPAYRVIQPKADEPKGLSLLPPHSALDVFFDIEGDPMVEGGLEYLWGATYFNDQGERDFKDFWAHDADQEKQAFADFINWVYQRWQQDPTMHVYHYAHYEIAAIRRLMGRYGVCEHQVDELLRHEVFVDLYAIVRHGLRIGEPNYSIKSVEHIYRGKRDTAVANGGDSVVVYEAWRDNPDGLTWQDSDVLNNIRLYNKDDCDSTQELVDWLRDEQQQAGIEFARIEKEDKPIDEEKVARAAKKQALHDDLMARAEALKATDPAEAAVAELMAQLLFFHEREAKPTWWKLFDRMSMDDAQLYEDADCIAYARRTDREAFKLKPRDRNLCYEYQIDPEQELKLPKAGRSYYVLGAEGEKVEMAEFNPKTYRFSLKSKTQPAQTLTLIPDEFVNPRPIPEAIEAVAQAYLDEPESPTALLRFLRRDTTQSQAWLNQIANEAKSEQRIKLMIHLLIEMEQGVLTIQGPPGAGKTFTAKHLILALLQADKRIGIASNSHKAIFNLMKAIAELAQKQGLEFPMMHTNQSDQEEGELLGIACVQNKDLPGLVAEYEQGFMIGTTAWGFAREDMCESLDYLFIDEAGQVSLANLVGMSSSAESLILLGDQMQLGQPIQGSHPSPTDLSILDYFLQGHHTIPPELGVFLGMTYRMHPDVNDYISNAFYDGRLGAAADCAKQRIDYTQPIEGIAKSAGLVLVEVEHQGNSQASIEEVEKILALKDALIGQTFTNQKGEQRPISLDDILFIAPYNYQVSYLKRALGSQAKVGSVDLFQGQEAPIVILSMCASYANETARGVEFLLNPNRLNVAISRAQALAIVVASPTLVDIELESETQIQLVNRFEMLKAYAVP
ncbi:TM0106 family RecB-like putative nuclease [Thiomicrospira microaerophila]|uniref:TM0106 family RecB-like putative nuclease n=1 Tax=Thiomicrospira microaerophila TaxID=406020 RepID=UPI0005CB153A|nr:TM0106 family RecB-like putative nuclease [Thiomicrospira microaerophila]